MQVELQNHYENIRKAITGNIATIQTLINQADSLQKIVESISEDTDKEKKEKLQTEVSNINSSISTLIDNTSKLFTLYDDFVKAVVKAK